MASGTARRVARTPARPDPWSIGWGPTSLLKPYKMSRYTHLVAVFVSLAAAPALAQISWEGSVLPTAPVGFPILGGVDTNNDGVSDFLFAGGNQIITDGINQTDPTGVTGIGLPWNAEQVWRAYDSAQNILVGDAGGSGTLSIFAGGKLRYQHLVIGGVSEGTAGATGLVVNPPGAIGDRTFSVSSYTNGNAVGGAGLVTISGFGSLFNNDPNLIDRADQIALNLANADPLDNVVVDLASAVQTAGNPFATFSTRAENEGFDVVVGLDGTGALSIEAGGRAEIQDALMVGVDSQSNGQVTVDGVGSSLAAYGRRRLLANLSEVRSSETASFIGGRGTGSLTVSNGARGDFYNGLSVGGPGGADLSRESFLGDGSGVMTVTGAGSTVNVYPSVVTAGSFNPTGIPAGGPAGWSLIIGERRSNAISGNLDDATLNPADATLQQGNLVISANAVVNAAGRNGVSGNAAVGKRGLIDFAGGRLQVDNHLEHDGTIKGYGTLRSDTLETSTYSVIRGGDADSQNTALTDPLQIVLLNASTDANDPALRNRGLIDGRTQLEVSGLIVNEGRIETSGEITANSLVTNTTSQIRSYPSSASPLRLQLSNDRAAGDSSGDNFGALHNRGLIEGNLDFLVAGGVVNGDNYLPTSAAPANGSAASGTISGSGRILAGQFLNNADAEVRVGQGESLVIHANGNNTSFPSGAGIPVVGGGGLAYRTLNLGSISVNGGDLEIGYLPESGAPFDFFIPAGTAFNNAEIFTNARFAVPDAANPGQFLDNTAGTIVANDATLHFTTGMINLGGVMAFTGGTNTVNGPVYNAFVDYGTLANPAPLPGVILVSGDGTSVTFEDDVVNDGSIGIGPFGSVVNFLGDLTNNGVIDVAFDAFGSNGSAGAYIEVAGGVSIQGGTIGFAFISQPAVIDPDFSVALITAGELSDDSLFTNLVLPDLPAGKYWDVVYDTVNDEVRLEMVMSNAFGADFTGDGVVSQADVDVWIRNAGIESGASVIQGDADLDGDVDLADYDILMTQLFTGVPVAVGGVFSSAYVPEPTSLLLMLLAAAPLAGRRR